MDRVKKQRREPPEVLRAIALRYPEAEEGIACKGTSLECSAFKARNKTFLFLGASELKLKLLESQAEAAALAAKQPDRYQIGSSGWVTVRFVAGNSAPVGLLERWIDESYRAMMPKQLVAMLPASGAPVAASGQSATKPRAKQKKPKSR